VFRFFDHPLAFGQKTNPPFAGKGGSVAVDCYKTPLLVFEKEIKQVCF